MPVDRNAYVLTLLAIYHLFTLAAFAALLVRPWVNAYALLALACVVLVATAVLVAVCNALVGRHRSVHLVFYVPTVTTLLGGFLAGWPVVGLQWPPVLFPVVALFTGGGFLLLMIEWVSARGD